MAQLEIKDQTSILLNFRITDGRLEVLYEGQPLPDDGVRVLLDDGVSTVIRIADFIQDNICYRAQASTVQRDGMLLPWTREDSGVRSLDLTASDAEQRLRVRAQAVGYDDVTATARMSADYDLSIYEDDIEVWIPKKGSKPTG
jgi:hypothetical protein